VLAASSCIAVVSGTASAVRAPTRFVFFGFEDDEHLRVTEGFQLAFEIH
jgi:hypothetical protein